MKNLAILFTSILSLGLLSCSSSSIPSPEIAQEIEVLGGPSQEEITSLSQAAGVEERELQEATLLALEEEASRSLSAEDELTRRRNLACIADVSRDGVLDLSDISDLGLQLAKTCPEIAVMYAEDGNENNNDKHCMNIARSPQLDSEYVDLGDVAEFGILRNNLPEGFNASYCSDPHSPEGDPTSSIEDDGLAPYTEAIAYIDLDPNRIDTNQDGLSDYTTYQRSDFDGDGVLNVEDNCLTISNPEQVDSDGDGMGDACEAVSCPSNFCQANSFLAGYHCDGDRSVQCGTDGNGCYIEVTSTGCSGQCTDGLCEGSGTNPTGESLLLYSSMDSTEAIFSPEVSSGFYGTMAEAIPGMDDLTFEVGAFSLAAKYHGDSGDRYFNGITRFRGENFDFADLEDDGGRVDFWIKFNTDPHNMYGNEWLARSNWGTSRYINLEFSGQPSNFFVDFYGEIPHDPLRTNYGNFRATMTGYDSGGWDLYENIQEGEWHIFTILWRRNGGPHKAELHFFIDGSQEGCSGCSDFGGNLPAEGKVTDFVISPDLYAEFVPFSVDEFYAFNSWDVSGIEGTFPELTWSDDVKIKYPQDNRGFYQGVWGPPVASNQLVTFEFIAINDQKNSFSCDLYVDGTLSRSVSTSHLAHTEVTHPSLLSEGSHTCQVKCDGGQMVSRLIQFNAEPQ